MASNNNVTVEHLITCVICYELFDDPRVMPCSHAYCRKCIEQTASAKRDQFECPLLDGCKILKKDIGSLPLNRAIRNLVELYESQSILLYKQS
jgi:tripartite motif-containing protein 59